MTTAVGRPVIFGEVLFDRFEDGTAVLGGAPFNVAWHLQGFGLEPLFVSRIGDDPAGHHVLETMAAWGMDTRGVQLDPRHPTGAVEVTLRQGQPTFNIVPEQAYDFIDDGLLEAVVAENGWSLLYHGTLIARSQASRAALYARRAALQLPVFVDVNLRPPWWDADTLAQALEGARWAKLNEDELAMVLGLEQVPRDELQDRARALVGQADLELLVVTLGADGACVVAGEHLDCAPPVAVETLVDTVGAGDAFSAVTLLGLSRGWAWPALLERALAFASRICGIRGATIEDRELYRQYLQNWGHG